MPSPKSPAQDSSQANDKASPTISGTLNALSCLRCKVRKTKCSKEEPICASCETADAECVYPRRQPKKTTGKDRAKVIEDILSRLDVIEEHLAITDAKQKVGRRKGDARKTVPSTVGCEFTLDEQDETSGSDINEDAGAGHLVHLQQLVTEATANTQDALDSPQVGNTPGDQEVVAPLNESLAFLGTIKVKPAKQMKSQDFVLPIRLVKKWVEESLNSPFFGCFYRLLDTKMLLSLPDIVNTTGVTLDNSVLIVYYNAIFQGWVNDPLSASVEYRSLGSQLYHQCLKLLPAWKRDGKVHMVEYIALMLMIEMCIENWDYHLAYRFYVASCEVAVLLGIPQLDNPDHKPSKLIPMLESIEQGEAEVYRNRLRRCFWHGVQAEFYFRLYYDKPAVMTKTNFHVNMPKVGELATVGTDAETIFFIVNSRITFITKDFIDLLDQDGITTTDLYERVKKLCDEIEELMLEWKIKEWFESAPSNRGERWMYSDLLINAYLTIILMEKKVNKQQSVMRPPTERSVSAARTILATINTIANIESHIMPVSFNFVSFYPFASFFTLYQSILYRLQKSSRDPTSPRTTVMDLRVEEDIQLMEKLEVVFKKLAQTHVDIQPIINALEALNKVARNVQSHRSTYNSPQNPADQSSPGQRTTRQRQHSGGDAGSPPAKRLRAHQVRSPPKTSTKDAYLVGSTETIPGMPAMNFASNDGSQQNFNVVTNTSVYPYSIAGQNNLDELMLQQPQLLNYVETIENDLFGRNWHEDWWTID